VRDRLDPAPGQIKVRDVTLVDHGEGAVKPFG
jgi:hypothetical protein